MKLFTRQTKLKEGVRKPPAELPTEESSDPREYWTHHNVTQHHVFSSIEESLEYLHWRNDQYLDYIEMLPVSGHDGKVVLDYGCGPGHDLVGFGSYSRPGRLVGADVSPTSLAEARARLALHRIDVDLLQVDERNPVIPLPAGSVEYIHCSGVLHHVSDPSVVLREFARILAPTGEVRLMVYNYDSLWLHYYTAYQKQLVERKFTGLEVRDAFAKTTDGENCPIARVYKPQEMVTLAAEEGFACEFLGAAISVFELSLLPGRFAAIMDQRLPAESRRFLLGLHIDERGLPRQHGVVAGIDGCYSLRRRSMA